MYGLPPRLVAAGIRPRAQETPSCAPKSSCPATMRLPQITPKMSISAAAANFHSAATASEPHGAAAAEPKGTAAALEPKCAAATTASTTVGRGDNSNAAAPIPFSHDNGVATAAVSLRCRHRAVEASVPFDRVFSSAMLKPQLHWRQDSMFNPASQQVGAAGESVL